MSDWREKTSWSPGRGSLMFWILGPERFEVEDLLGDNSWGYNSGAHYMDKCIHSCFLYTRNVDIRSE